MKLRIKTEFWNNNNPEDWKERYLKINEGHLIMYITIIAGLLLNAKPLIALAAGIMLTITMIMTISNKRYNEKKRRCTKPTLHNFGRNNKLSNCKWCGKDFNDTIIEEEEEDGRKTDNEADTNKQS